MTFTIGRATLLSDPYSWRQSGNLVEIEGTINDTSIHVVKALRQQLLGYVNNLDEPVIPVTSTTDTHIDGFYRVSGVNVDVDRGGHALKQYGWSVGLERVSDYSMPLIESVMLAPDTIRDNDLSIPNSRVYHVLPVSATQRSLSIGSAPTFSSEDGNMEIQYEATDGSVTAVINNLVDGVETYLLAPGDWYDGACRIELDYADDGTFRPVVGRQIPNLVGEGRWRIGNGIIRITLEDSSEFIFGVSRWTGSAWTTPTEFFLGDQAPAGVRREFLVPETMTVLRNSVEQVIVRFYCKADQASFFTLPYVVDFTLNRGMPWVEIRVNPGWDAAAITAAVGRATNQAGEAFSTTSTEANLDDAGLKATSADSDGFKYVIVTPRTIDNLRTTEGIVGLTLTTSEIAVFAVGLSTDTGAASSTSRPEWSALSFLAAQSETVRVVER